jgi:hypothetical protein
MTQSTKAAKTALLTAAGRAVRYKRTPPGPGHRSSCGFSSQAPQLATRMSHGVSTTPNQTAPSALPPLRKRDPATEPATTRAGIAGARSCLGLDSPTILALVLVPQSDGLEGLRTLEKVLLPGHQAASEREQLEDRNADGHASARIRVRSAGPLQGPGRRSRESLLGPTAGPRRRPSSSTRAGGTRRDRGRPPRGRAASARCWGGTRSRGQSQRGSRRSRVD